MSLTLAQARTMIDAALVEAARVSAQAHTLALTQLGQLPAADVGGVQAWIEASFGAPFNDFAGSVVVHAMGGWIALAAWRMRPGQRPEPSSE